MTLRKDNWLATGLTLLTESGPNALTIERLCKALKVTKGSFYHHFDSRDDYQRSLMAYWREQNTERLVGIARAAEPRMRSQVLSELARGADAGAENAVRGWARRDAEVAQQVAAVDLARTDYLRELIAPQLPAGRDAALVAKLVYAHFVGVQQLPELIDDREWAAMDRLLMDVFLGP